MNENQLTDKETLFCELYAHGDAPFGGNATKCYREVFGDDTNLARYNAHKLLMRPEIQEFLSNLETLTFEEVRYMKRFLTQNLMSIIEECACVELRDKKGKLLSPAGLRNVAVSASKVIMDMYPLKVAQKSELSINGNGEGGITFNVIMPDANDGSTDK